MPKRGPQRQRLRLCANSRTATKSRACHFGGAETESNWPAKCIVPVGTGRRVLEQEKQVTNWINSGGHVPRRYIEDNETTARERTGCWKIPLAIGSVLLALPLASGQARDLDGRYANSPLKQWFDSLKSGKGPCCSDADGSAVSDVDWESKSGRYRVRIEGEWHEVPEDAVITEPNRVGRTMIWPVKYPDSIHIRCFMPGAMT